MSLDGYILKSKSNANALDHIEAIDPQTSQKHRRFLTCALGDERFASIKNRIKSKVGSIQVDKSVLIEMLDLFNLAPLIFNYTNIECELYVTSFVNQA